MLLKRKEKGGEFSEFPTSFVCVNQVKNKHLFSLNFVLPSLSTAPGTLEGLNK